MSDRPSSSPDLASIVARLDAVQDLVQRINDEVDSGTMRGAEPIIERHRPEVYAAMEGVGMAVYEFLESGPAPDRLAVAQDLVISRLRDVTLTSPVSLYGARGKRARYSYFEIIEHVRAGRATGADIPTRVLDDYYIHTRIGEAFVNRLTLFTRRLVDQAAHFHAERRSPINVLSLQYVGADEVLPLAKNPGLLANLRVTCLDSDVAAVRHAEQTLRRAFTTHLQVTLADPASWLQGPACRSDSVCIVYAVQLLEQLATRRVVRILQGVHRVLRAGGVLLIGTTSGDVPVGEQMIRDWLLGWDWRYRSESEWRELFAQTPFGADRLAFEYEPLGVSALIRAQKYN